MKRTCPVIDWERVNHQQRTRLALRFAYDETIIEQVRRIPGRVWNVSNRYWHVPDDEMSRRYLWDKFGLEIPEEGLSSDTESEKPPFFEVHPTTRTEMKIRVAVENERWLKVYVPREQKDWIRRIKEIPGRRWDWERKYWRVAYVKESLWLLQRGFSAECYCSEKKHFGIDPKPGDQCDQVLLREGAWSGAEDLLRAAAEKIEAVAGSPERT